MVQEAVVAETLSDDGEINETQTCKKAQCTFIIDHKDSTAVTKETTDCLNIFADMLLRYAF